MFTPNQDVNENIPTSKINLLVIFAHVVYLVWLTSLLILASIAYFIPNTIIPVSYIVPFIAAGIAILAFELSRILSIDHTEPKWVYGLASPLVILPFYWSLPAWANFGMILGAALMPFILKLYVMLYNKKNNAADPNIISYITLLCGMTALIVAFLPLPVLHTTLLVQPALMMFAAVMLGFTLANQRERPNPSHAQNLTDAIILTLGCAGIATSCVLLSAAFQAGSAAALWTLALSAIVLFVAIFIAKTNVNRYGFLKHERRGQSSQDSSSKSDLYIKEQVCIEKLHPAPLQDPESLQKSKSQLTIGTSRSSS